MILLSTPGFQSPTDIANRALDHCGADHHIDDLLTDISKNQRLILGVYTKLRQAELRRNNWRHSIRHSIIRPIAETSLQWTPPAWDLTVTYRIGQVVAYDDGFGSRLWINVTPANLNHPPGTGIYWDNYFGQVVANVFDTKEAYYTGDVVYEADGAGSFVIYMSIMQGAADDPATTQAYVATTTYWKDQIVTVASVNYISKVDSNLGHDPATSAAQWATTSLSGSRQWVQLGGTLAQLAIMYPIGSGPTIQSSTRNVYPLPYGFLRKAPQDPKAGLHSILGAPTNRPADDWLLEGNYLITRDGNPINFRFIADVSVVAMFDPMFCEGLGGRIAFELCEPITQSTEKVKAISSTYEKFMREARLVNGIEGEAEEPAEDDWITTRI
jgi:hypothetical protein